MPTLLLLCFLLLGSSNFCDPHAARNTPAPVPQSDTTLFNPLLEQIDSSEDPTLRVFLRLKVAAYLWKNPSASIKTESLVMAALADLRAHEKEMPAVYVNQFRRDLLAQLRAHAPEAAARLSDEYNPAPRTELEVAYSLLGQEGGADKAVGIVHRAIADGRDLGQIVVFFLNRLDKVKPAEVPKVLGSLMSAEESHPGSISSELLFTLEHLFVREQTPKELQRRYFAVVINRAGETEAASVVDIYNTLTTILPVVEQQYPDIYATAGARLSQLEGQMPSGALERLSVDKRVSQSSDQLAQLLIEADNAKDQTLKQDLLTRAAQLAQEKGQTKTAIELALKFEPKNARERLWLDQFVDRAVDQALKKGEVELARYGAGRIESRFIRSSVLEKIALTLQGANDVSGARDTLKSALTLIESLDDSADKAVALFDLANAYVKVDSQRAPNLIRAAVKTINKLPAVSRGPNDNGDTHLADVENAMKIAYVIIPAFQEFGGVDNYAALDLAKDVQRRELRIAATLGAYIGSPTVGKTKSGLASR